MGLVKILIGASMLTVAYFCFPVIQALEWFLYIIMPLIIIFVAVGLISDGMYVSIKGFPNYVEDLRQKVGQYREARAVAAPASN